MKHQKLRLLVLDVDEADGVMQYSDLVQYRIEIGNGDAWTWLDFYEWDDAFKEFGKNLQKFPNDFSDAVHFEANWGDESLGYHLLLKVWCYEPNGRTAFQVKIANIDDAPTTRRVEFSLCTVPGYINDLGLALQNWNPVEIREFEWTFF